MWQTEFVTLFFLFLPENCPAFFHAIKTMISRNKAIELLVSLFELYNHVQIGNIPFTKEYFTLFPLQFSIWSDIAGRNVFSLFIFTILILLLQKILRRAWFYLFVPNYGVEFSYQTWVLYQTFAKLVQCNRIFYWMKRKNTKKMAQKWLNGFRTKLYSKWIHIFFLDCGTMKLLILFSDFEIKSCAQKPISAA